MWQLRQRDGHMSRKPSGGAIGTKSISRIVDGMTKSRQQAVIDHAAACGFSELLPLTVCVSYAPTFPSFANSIAITSFTK
jgi:hypothetical protein